MTSVGENCPKYHGPPLSKLVPISAAMSLREAFLECEFRQLGAQEAELPELLLIAQNQMSDLIQHQMSATGMTQASEMTPGGVNGSGVVRAGREFTESLRKDGIKEDDLPKHMAAAESNLLTLHTIKPDSLS
jgi:hypothetical protein